MRRIKRVAAMLARALRMSERSRLRRRGNLRLMGLVWLNPIA